MTQSRMTRRLGMMALDRLRQGRIRGREQARESGHYQDLRALTVRCLGYSRAELWRHEGQSRSPIALETREEIVKRKENENGVRNRTSLPGRYEGAVRGDA